MRIGEIAQRSGTSAKTIRFYEQAGLLPAPARTPAGYRDYSPDVADRLEFIRRGQAAGLTLEEIRQVLAIHDRGDVVCAHVRSVLHSRLDQVRGQLAELVTLEGHLQALLQRAEQELSTEHDQSAVCWILEGEPADGDETDAGETST